MPEPAVLAIIDAPDWAHDKKAAALARCLRGRFRVEKRLQAEVTRADLESADLVLVFYWHQFGARPDLRQTFAAIKGKLLCGICSHVELEGEHRAPGVAFLREHARAVFVHSELLRAEFAGDFAAPLYMLPNGVDTTFFKPVGRPTRTPAGPLRVGWAGSAANFGRALRGLDDVILPAVAQARGVELRTAIREEGQRDAVGMRDFYRGLDVYVCASRAEGTPNPCLEAAASGVPLLTTPVGNMPEFVRDGMNGMFITRDPADLARKLTLLRDDRTRCAAMGRAARMTSLAWEWALRAEAYADMFAAVLHANAVAGASCR